MIKILKQIIKSSRFFELLLIFLGITLSMQFNNWNEERKQRKKEIEIISAIYIDVNSDLKDVKNVINRLDMYYIGEITRLDSCISVKNPVNAELFDKPLTIPMGSSFLSRNNGAYQNLKYEGSNLIKNNSLKSSIFDYYESRLNWIDTNQQWKSDFGSNYILPIFLKYCNEELKLTYQNYLQLREDKLSVKLLMIWKQHYTKTKNLHLELIPVLDKLKHNLEEELITNGENPDQILKEIQSGIIQS